MNQSCPILKRPFGRISKKLGRIIPIIRRRSYQSVPFVQWHNLIRPLTRNPTRPVPSLGLETIKQKALQPLSRRQEIQVRQRNVAGQIPTCQKPLPHLFPIQHLLHLLLHLLLHSVDQKQTQRFGGWICLHLLASSIFLMQYTR